MTLSKKQIDAIKRLDKVISMEDGSASECHEYYCPYNIGMLEDILEGKRTGIYTEYDNKARKYIKKDREGNISTNNGYGVYHGKPDGFDSECPRFLSINREKGEWDCLCGLEVIAMLLGIPVPDLYDELKAYFKKEEILGYNVKWRKNYVS